MLDKLGEALFGCGLMSSATAWYDRGTASAGSNVDTDYAVVEIAAPGTNTYGKIYHLFAVNDDFDNGYEGLYVQSLGEWDAVNHVATGEYRYDYPTADLLGQFSIQSNAAAWMARIGNFNEPSDFVIKTYESGKLKYFQLNCGNEVRFFCMAPGDLTLQSHIPSNVYDYAVPLGIHTLRAGQYGPVSVNAINYPRRVICPGGYAGYQSTWSRSYLTGWQADGGATYPAPLLCRQSNGISGIAGVIVGPGGVYNAEVWDDRPVMHRNYALLENVYTDYFTGDIGVLYGMSSVIAPQRGDVLVVQAGVEEYEALEDTVSANYNNNKYHNATLVARII